MVSTVEHQHNSKGLLVRQESECAPVVSAGFPSSPPAVPGRCLFNEHTGLYFTPRGDRSRGQRRLDRLCKSLDNYADVYGLSVYFLSLTLSPENVGCSAGELQRFVKFMLARVERASGEKARYVWVLELQRKRWIRTGVHARHWHLAVAVPDGALPHVRFVKRARQHYQVVEDGSAVPVAALYKGWGQGQVFCERATTGVYRYLSKYISKEEGYREFGPRVRGYGSSVMGPGAWEPWTSEVIWTWQALGELADRRVRKVGGRLELVEAAAVPTGRLRGWCELGCSGGSSCWKCQSAVHRGQSRWRVVESVGTPWRVVNEEDVPAVLLTRARGDHEPATLTRSEAEPWATAALTCTRLTLVSDESRGNPSDALVEADRVLAYLSKVR